MTGFRMVRLRALWRLAPATALLSWIAPAFAEDARDWQLGMQAAATPVREHIDALNDELLVIITVITLFVMGLLLYVIVRFNAKRHPVPSKTTHNTILEVLWTVVPVLILVIIAIPSFKLLYFMDKNPHPQMTLKVTGHQWYWSYEYPDQGDIGFDSNILPDDQAAKNGQPRLLAVDNPVVVPLGTVVRLLITGTDVIHSWYVPAAGVQEYAVVGRINESWMQFDRLGTFYGQCNQICGLNHPFMPIQINVVSQNDFNKWVDDKKKSAAREGAGTVTLAAAAAR
ncbi:MAG TPA: cytochrome c oxidase subunit II [Stellaceae bacterium]|nr:cytochrome c oxidase subunit II [Stellaceae bacterium]